MNKSLKKSVGTFLKSGIAILVVYFLFESGWLTKSTFIKIFHARNFPFFLFSCLFYLSAQILSSVRLIQLLSTINIHVRLSYAFRLTMIGNFFNTIIPGSFGGDTVKAFYLIKNEETQKGQSIGILLVDRIVGLLSLIIISLISLIFLLWKKNAISAEYHDQFSLAMVATCVLFVFCCVLFLLGGNQRLWNKLKLAIFRFSHKSFYYNLAWGVGTVIKQRRIVAYSILLSIAIQICSISGLLMVSHIIVSIIPAAISKMAISSIVMLLSAIPITPGNIGWTELMGAFGWAALGSSTGAEVFFYWRIVVVFCSLPGGLLYLGYRLKTKVDNKQKIQY